MEGMQKLCDLFRETREKKGINIKEASSSTKIRESILSALENGNYQVFTSETHAKSFIRSYAKYLGINEDKALAMYRREREFKKEDDDNSLFNKNRRNYSLSILTSSLFNLQTLIGIILGTILILVVYFFYTLWVSANQPPSLIVIKPKDNEVIEQESFVIEGITNSPFVKVVVDGNEANYIDKEGRFIVNAKFNQPGFKRFTIIAENEFKKRTEYNLDLIYRPVETKIQKQKIRITNNSDIEKSIAYSKDARTSFDSVKINPKDTLEIEFDFKIEIKNFEPNTMNLYINEDTIPIRSIDTSQFSITIESARVIIKTK